MRGFWPVLLIGMALIAIGCAPKVQRYSAPHAAPQIVDDKLLTGSNKVLPIRVWEPDKDRSIKAAIIALHGFNDYSNAFVNPGYYISARDIAVYAYDQRGFGDTEDRGIWAGQENLTGDLKQMVLAIREMHPDVPLYLLGESMGGAVVINALAQPDFPKVDGAILSAPAVWGSKTMPPLYRGVLWAGAHTVPWLEVTGSNLKILATNNIPLLREMGRDPLIIKETRVDAIYGIMQLMDNAYSNAKKVDVPLLLLYGMNDQVIPSQPIVEVADTLDTKYKLVYYPRGFHMLLRDLTSEVVMDDIIAWAEDPEGFLPSGYDLNWRMLMAGDAE
ncbi:MAG: lysophospholipase [Alphaproteobacteria bacterium]|nr:lysophospholipase [Alphaproteobacteria bacterium]